MSRCFSHFFEFFHLRFTAFSRFPVRLAWLLYHCQWGLSRGFCNFSQKCFSAPNDAQHFLLHLFKRCVSVGFVIGRTTASKIYKAVDTYEAPRRVPPTVRTAAQSGIGGKFRLHGGFRIAGADSRTRENRAYRRGAQSLCRPKNGQTPKIPCVGISGVFGMG